MPKLPAPPLYPVAVASGKDFFGGVIDRGICAVERTLIRHGPRRAGRATFSRKRAKGWK